jgi:hypothetical protein
MCTALQLLCPSMWHSQEHIIIIASQMVLLSDYRAVRQWFHPHRPAAKRCLADEAYQLLQTTKRMHEC